jgi:putative ABC transport system substrate-binding protein
MRRFGAVLLMAALLAAVSPAAAADLPVKMFRVGLLHVGAPDTGILSPGVVKEFERRGFVAGRTILFERRAAVGQLDKLPALVRELVAAHVDVILTTGYGAAVAAKDGAPAIPVVVTGTGDPVATGLVQSLAHPGGHVTGVSEVAAELSAKRLQLLQEAVPGIRSVAVLWNADDRSMTLRYQAAELEANKLGLVVMPLGVRAPDDFETAFSAMSASKPDAILMVTDVLTMLNRQRIITFAAAHRLPTMFEYANLAHDGGLLAYGPNQGDIDGRAVDLAIRILRGASPADLPLELPTRFELALNLRTAASLGLTIPNVIQSRADDLIE